MNLLTKTENRLTKNNDIHRKIDFDYRIGILDVLVIENPSVTKKRVVQFDRLKSRALMEMKSCSKPLFKF